MEAANRLSRIEAVELRMNRTRRSHNQTGRQKNLNAEESSREAQRGGPQPKKFNHGWTQMHTDWDRKIEDRKMGKDQGRFADAQKIFDEMNDYDGLHCTERKD